MTPATVVRNFVAAVLLGSFLSGPAMAAPDAGPLETSAKQAIVVDGETGAVLFERDADTPFPPASLAKLMTMEVVFAALKAGRLRLHQEFPVSEHAWRTGGAPSGTSTMFAKLKSKVPLEALIRGIVVQAANDAAIVVAEGMAGSEADFAEEMNASGKAIGLVQSRFVNPTGLPAPEQQVTVRDLTILARHIKDTYPDFYRIYSEPDFEWNKIRQRNRNPLLPMNIGATGMGTGYTEASGYSLVGVTERNGRETFIALGGLSSIEERAAEAKRLLEWSDSRFQREELFASGSRVGSAVVFGGTRSDVSLLTKEAIVAYIPSDRADSVSAHVEYDGPLLAPIQLGAKIGRIEIKIDDKISVTKDLFAGEAVGQGTLADRALDAAKELAFGWIKSL